ncbi:MAG: hypothetical protein HC895_19610 [Leptolyngbyaceae cyanobacterium SM1_3_5]|nr:hypothetical protein [Leptolyngbyaceae cyanobacterium SM1_3_5]
MLNRLKLAGIGVAIACTSFIPTPTLAQTTAPTPVQTSVREAVTFSCRDSEAAIRRKMAQWSQSANSLLHRLPAGQRRQPKSDRGAV